MEAAVMSQHPDAERRPATNGEIVQHVRTIFNCEVALVTIGAPATPFDVVEDRLRGYERRFSRFVAGNELASLNASSGRWVDISPDMERLLTHALAVAVESRGLVNIAVTGALKSAGYVSSWPRPWPERDPREVPGPVPPLTEILEVRRGRARLGPGHGVDFGGIAKGLWADEAVEMLGPRAAASLGGDVSARGPGPGGEGWPIGLPNGRTVLVRDGGVATSGVTKRRSGSAHHVIDPRTGLPSRSGLREVTVVAKNAATAEWAATALLVAGAERLDLRRHPDVNEIFTIPDDLTEGSADEH